jgi:HPt (histidine-containing phosphotransfer) domain-containing protein
MNPIDLTRLRDFSDGTEAGLRDLAGLFVTHMDECVTALRRGVETQDVDLIRVEAHRGAGTFGACGAQVLSALLARLEQVAGNGEFADARTLLPQVEEEVTRVRGFLGAAIEPVGPGDHGFAKDQP